MLRLVSHHQCFAMDNLKFDMAGIQEVQRILVPYNTYQFFALYANVDGLL